MKYRLHKICIVILAFAFMSLSVGKQLSLAGEPANEPLAISETGTTETEQNTSKTKEERLRELALEKAELTVRQKRITRDEKARDYKSMESLYNNGLVSLQELNDAKKDMEDSALEYDQAKLDLQVAELQSLKAAWHITIRKTRLIDKGDKKEIEITLENTSEKVRLERTQKMIDEKIIDPVDTEVNPEINDIYISIKEGDNIIGYPYEQYIPSLKLGEPQKLVFTLIKDVEDVVISMRYEDQEDRRNIHLEKLEPYISVVRAVKYYKTVGDERKRMLAVTIRNGAEEMVGERMAVDGAMQTEQVETEEFIDLVEEPPPTEAESSDRDDPLNDINNIYVSIRDEQMNIIGIPYEIRIPVLKYKEQKKYRFEIKKDVNSVVISMNYLKREHIKVIYLEPDTRHISIVKAEVRQLLNSTNIEPRRRGKKEVTLELVNRSESGKIPFAEEEEATGGSTGSPGEIRNVFVSLKHNGVIIADPYEAVIERLEYNKPHKETFTLQQQEVNDVTVLLSYLGRTEEKNVYLVKVSPPGDVTINSVGFAQEGTLRSSVKYDLTLERLAEEERIFKLRVINLSDEFSFRFNDPQAGTRITQLKFTHAQFKRQLSLEISLPERMDLGLLDVPQEFYAAVLTEEDDAKHAPGKLVLNDEELGKIASKVKLVLTPKGVGEIELVAQNLYFEIKTDEFVEMLVTLKNTGTRNLDDIRITADLPSNKWNADIQPDLITMLEREGEKEIKIIITPPSDVGVGASEVKIKAECEVDNEKVEALDKNVTIKIGSRTNIIGSAILIGALILLVVGIAVLTIRLSRR